MCKVSDYSQVDMEREYCFTGRTDEEKSLVCPAVMVLSNVAKREDGWKSFKIERPLDFSLMGMLAETFQSLAHSQIGIFAIATYDTDDILIKEENYQRALDLLEEIGYQVV